MRAVRTAAWAVVAVLLALSLSACRGMPAQSQLKPTVFPPSIAEKGVLRAGVDLSAPPFGGTDGGRQAGLDIDVASALASKLGLALKVVDVKPADAASALASGTVDVVLSVPYTADALSQVAIAGSYATEGPAFFSAIEASTSTVPTYSLDTLNAEKIGAQRGSPAYWALVSQVGSDTVTAYTTLRDAMSALDKGEVQVVGGDAYVGAYIARDMPSVRYAGQIASGTPIGVAVSTQNTTLEDAVRKALDGLAGDGVLSAVRTKWVGSLPILASQGAADASASPSATALP